jgi:glycosidase
MQARAAARGIPHFHIFGEVFAETADTALLARFTRTAGMPAVLDFALAAAIRQTVAEDAGTSVLARVFADDALYEGGVQAALQLPTFISNHDMGRFAYFVRKFRPNVPDAEVLARVALAHAMLFTLRGVPVVYYGDEQGFAGIGKDQDARQDLFASQVASYNGQRLVGTTSTTAVANFNATHPLYRLIARLAAVRSRTPALRRGMQVVRSAGEVPGMFAVSRIDPDDGHEVLIAFNTASQPIRARVEVNATSSRFHALEGACAGTVKAPGSYEVTLPPLGFAICEQEPSQ